MESLLGRTGQHRARLNLEPLPHLQNGHDVENGHDVSPTTPEANIPPDVNELTNNIASMKVSGHQSNSRSIDLNAIIGKGFSFQAFVKLLKDSGVSNLESHFKWLVELTCNADDEYLQEERIKILKEKMTSWVSESDDHLSVFQTVAQKLLLAVYSGFLSGETDEVRQYFIEAQEAIDTTNDSEGTDIEQLRVYRYIKMTDQLVISGCTRLLSNSDTTCAITIEDLKAEILNYDITGRPVFCDKASKATFLGMKGHLANQLGETSMSIDLFRQASEMNPNCYDWQHHYYTALRRRRRESEFGVTPGNIEHEVCLRAHKLRPKYWNSLLSLANLYEDIRRAKKPRPVTEVRRQELELDIINALKEAQRQAPHNVTVNLKLAEALAGIRNPLPEDIEECKELFNSCLEQWPNNSQVLHKMGKFYNKFDARIALHYFEEALETDPLNFPCLMDYLRAKLPMLSNAKMITVMDVFLPEYRYKKIFHCKLAALKGYFQWVGNDRTSAIKTWLIVFDNDDDAEKEKIESYFKKTLTGYNDLVPHHARVPVKLQLVETKLVEVTPELVGAEDSVQDAESKIEEFKVFLRAAQSDTNNYVPNSNWRANRTVSTSSSVEGETNNRWRRQQNTNTSQRRQPLFESFQNDENNTTQRDVNGRGDTNRTWRRNANASQTTVDSVPFGDSRRAGNHQQHIYEDTNWRSRELEQNDRNIVVNGNEDLRITINNMRERRVEGAGDSRLNGDRRNYEHPHSISRIQLDSNGQWKQVDIESDIRGSNGRMDSRDRGRQQQRRYQDPDENWR